MSKDEEGGAPEGPNDLGMGTFCLALMIGAPGAADGMMLSGPSCAVVATGRGFCVGVLYLTGPMIPERVLCVVLSRGVLRWCVGWVGRMSPLCLLYVVC